MNEIKKINFSSDKKQGTNRNSQSLFPYYVTRVGKGCYMAEIYRGRVVDSSLQNAWFYAEDQIKEAAEDARMIGGEICVVYMSEPITLREFCNMKDTSSITREKCLPYCEG